MPSLLHDSGARTLECLLELVDTSVCHWQLLVLLDLLCCLWCDTIDGGPSGIHLCLHRRRCLVPGLRVVYCLPMARNLTLVLVNIMRLLFGRNTDLTSSQSITLIVIADLAMLFLHWDPSTHLHPAITQVALTRHLLLLLRLLLLLLLLLLLMMMLLRLRVLLLSLYVGHHLFELG